MIGSRLTVTVRLAIILAAAPPTVRRCASGRETARGLLDAGGRGDHPVAMMNVIAQEHAPIDVLVAPGVRMLGWRRQRDPKVQAAVKLAVDLQRIAALRGEPILEFEPTDDVARYERGMEWARSVLERVRATLRMVEGATYRTLARAALSQSRALHRKLEESRGGALAVLLAAEETLAAFVEEERGDWTIPPPDPPGAFPKSAPLPLPHAR